MNRKALEWLYEQLPELVARGILTAENAERLREYYGPVVTQGGRTGLLIFGMIGALLVGLGLILIIGHNWDGFSRPVRAFIALGLLVAGQVVAGMALWFKAEQPAWLEGSAVFLQLAVGAGIALIGQTYHLTDDFSLYLLTWMLLTAPLVYLMTATAPAVIYLLGITCWLSTEHFSGIHKQWIWGLLALMLPHYWRLFQRDRYAGSTVLLSWLLPICIYFCVHLALGQYMKHTYPLVYSALFAITFFLGALWFDGDVKGWRQPLWNLGVAGGLGLAYIMSFKDFWESLRRNFRDGWWETGELFLTVTLLVVVSGLGFAVSRWRTGQYWLWGGGPFMTGVGYLLLVVKTGSMWPAILFNLYLLAVSVGVIQKGIRETALGILNAGMLMLSALVLMRFFDASFSFVARGLVFVVLGGCFLGANVVMARRRKEVAK